MDMDRVHVLGIGYPTADIHRMGSTYQVSLIQDV
jgi:hypothetical protein